jgi:hypothetical protein
MTDLSQEEISERIEHRDALLDARAVLATVTGRNFLKYLFKSLEVNELPQFGLEGNFLHDKLGFLRAGNAVFKLVAEADAEIAAGILAQIEKDRYVKLYAEAQIGQSR